MTYNPDLDDRYSVLGNDRDGAGFVLFDHVEDIFVRVNRTGVILALDTRRQAEALAEVMNIEDRERHEIAEHVEFPNGR